MLKGTSWRDILPELSGLPHRLSSLLDRNAQPLALAHETLMHPAKSPQSEPHVVLFRVQDSDGPVLTAAQTLPLTKSAPRCIAEPCIPGVLIPCDVVDELMFASTDFRALVFNAYARRMDTLLRVVGEEPPGSIPLNSPPAYPLAALH